MSSSYAADIEVSNTSNGTFIGEKPGDLVICTATSNQSILIGAHEHSNAALTVRDNMVEVNAALLVNSVPIADHVSSNVTIDASKIVSGTVSTVFLPTASTTAKGVVQLSDSTNTTDSTLAATSTAVKSAYDLAQSAHTLASMGGGGGGGGGGTVNLDETETIYVGNVVPRSNVIYDLGTSNLRFRDLFLSGNTIDLGGTKIKGDSNVSVLNLGTLAKGSAAKYSIGPLANKAATSWSLVSQSPGNWVSACWSPDLSLFVAVGVSTTGATNSVMTSPNGMTWTLRSTPVSTFGNTSGGQQWVSVCWASFISKFVAVSNGFVENERVMTSADGITWTLQNSYNQLQDGNPWTCVCAAPEIGLLVAVAANGTVMTSPDGITWTQRTPDVNFSHRSVCWSPELGLFAIVSASGDDRRVQTSPDGITWTSHHVPEYSWSSVCWSPELHKFVVVSESSGYTMTSSDGITWSAVMSSDDYRWISVAWSSELRLLVAVAYSQHVMTSVNGTTWTMRPTAPQGTWYGVCYSSDLNTFLTVGTNTAMVTSPQLPAALSTLVTNPQYLRMSNSNTLQVDKLNVGEALTVNAVPIAEHITTNLHLDAARITSGTISNALLLAASTSSAGIVQLSDSVLSVSSATAATSAAIKTTYDLASNALPKTGGIITGALTLNDVVLGAGIQLAIDEADPETISNSSNLSILKNTPRGTSTAVVVAWATSVDGPGTDSIQDVVVNGSNVYMSGTYAASNVVVYNPDNVPSHLTLRPSTSNTTAGFVTKSDANGNAQWAVTFDGPTTTSASTLAVDSQSNLLASFTYRVNGTIYNADGTDTVPLRTGVVDAVGVVKISPSGIAQWAVSMDATGSDGLGGICTDTNDNLFVAARYSGTGATMYNTSNVSSGITLSNTRGTAVYAACLLKYNSNGGAQWAASVHNTASSAINAQAGRSVCADKFGNAYWAGMYGGNNSSNTLLYNSNNTLSSNVTIRSATAGTAGFVVKYSGNGDAQWAASIDAALPTSSVIPYRVAIDATSNLYVAGTYNGTPVIYDASNVASTVTLPTSSNSAAFLLKYNSDGQPLWGASLDGTVADNAYALALDGKGDPYIGGSYSNSPVIKNANGSISGVTLSNSDTLAAFTVKFDSSGTAIWGTTIDAVGGISDQVRGINVDSDLNVYVASAYRSSNNLATTLYNSDNSNSGVSLRATTSNTLAASLVKYTPAVIVKPYKLVSNPTAVPNGQIKYVLNASSNAVTINVRDITDTLTLNTLTVNPGQMNTMIYYNNWYLT